MKKHMDLQSTTAKLLSILITPFSAAAVISVVFSWFSPIGVGPMMSALSSALIGILTLCVVPFLPVAYSARTGRTDLDVSDVSKRAPLYVPGLVSYAGAAAAFWTLENKIMFVMALAYLCVGVATFLVTLVWKISAHTAGIAGPTTALVIVFGPWIWPLYAVSILMIWSRVRLRAHTLTQAMAGLLVAIAITSLVFAVFYS